MTVSYLSCLITENRADLKPFKTSVGFITGAFP